MLVAIGSIISTLSQRLGRVVDRSRDLQALHGKTEGEEHDMIVRQMRMSDERIALIGRALLQLVLSALSIGVTVVLLFVQEFTQIGLNPFAAATFIVAIALLMWALVLFLRETRLAAATLRIPASYLERERKL